MTALGAAVAWRGVLRPALLVPAGAALVLVVALVGVLDDGYAMTVLRGVAVLLAAAWLTTTDDPAGEVLAASPRSQAMRAAARAVAGLVVVAPVFVVAALLVQWRAPEVPVLGLTLEALALGAAGLAVGTGLRSWHGLLQPAHVAAIGLVVVAYGTHLLPRLYRMQQEQTWGPPWEAAQIRWWALLVLAAAVLALAVQDPWERAGRRV